MPSRRVLADVSPNVKAAPSHVQVMKGNTKHTAVVPSPLKRSVTAMVGELDDGKGLTYLKRRRLGGGETLSQVEEKARGGDRRGSVTRSVFGTTGSPERGPPLQRPNIPVLSPPVTMEPSIITFMPSEPSPTEPNTPSDPGNDHDEDDRAPTHSGEFNEVGHASFSDLINYDPSSQVQTQEQKSSQLTALKSRTSRAEVLKLRLRVAMYKVRTNQVHVSSTDLQVLISVKQRHSRGERPRGEGPERATSEAVEEAVAELRREAQALLLRPREATTRSTPNLLTAPVLLPPAQSDLNMFKPLLPSSPLPVSGSPVKRMTPTSSLRLGQLPVLHSPDRTARLGGWDDADQDQELTSSVVKGRVAESLIGLRGAA
ncbi:hypothetical protein LTR02_016493 [Friedmanniomyces endolithicus]|uniref:Uncharacterized protein n=1 Tax=Friedmanniomyces endolithicus TaxID=329885 RepID=A0A4U0U5S0_9PEZI|nr:hypothetical protein LTS09_017877 [Friedmanniomyces endolithicus]KAK0333557.1 hypothetical protein LTR94_020269 [Friedmanniomyces endolithicus]KAK0769345.1 hypothetical protein LTR59_017089 [Friedmanniomyces endolithicus]KAK0782333.1 hypothetical protein LTR38_013395 [Friedmanniomyces endolithicus]KAK0793368.1 hypothetical protein LTR75_011168 [Friedmanniomyces endolithicus]